MKQPDDRKRVQHMLDYATEALDMVRGRERNDLWVGDLPPLVEQLRKALADLEE
ncbi:MAG: hypothetical protein M5U22_15700 [Thermoleophilia bacterium]|nr:hypothetical protein [Thermoleophilia bacterium]